VLKERNALWRARAPWPLGGAAGFEAGETFQASGGQWRVPLKSLRQSRAVAQGERFGLGG
jgi:hypothetical protein